MCERPTKGGPGSPGCTVTVMCDSKDSTDRFRLSSSAFLAISCVALPLDELIRSNGRMGVLSHVPLHRR
jgi:hypothetical protein